jgi:hypothetical protein
VCTALCPIEGMGRAWRWRRAGISGTAGGLKLWVKPIVRYSVRFGQHRDGRRRYRSCSDGGVPEGRFPVRPGWPGRLPRGRIGPGIANPQTISRGGPGNYARNCGVRIIFYGYCLT